MNDKKPRPAKFHPPHARSAPRDTTGKPDWNTIKGVTLTMIDQTDAGHYTFDDGGQVDPGNGSQEDEKALMRALRSLKPNQTLMWFVRGDVDPSDKAAS